MVRPICEYCKKSYGVKNTKLEMVFCPVDPDNPHLMPMGPRYSGNGVVLKETYSPDEKGWKNGDRAISASSYVGYGIKHEGPEGRSLHRMTWIPGDYSDPYRPFCKLRCALAFARSCYKAGYRIPS